MNKLISLTLLAVMGVAGCATDLEGDDQSIDEGEIVTEARDKSKSPETDLKNFPKLPAPQSQRLGITADTASSSDFSPTAEATSARSEDVYTVQMDGDGGGTITIYTPPAGLSAKELHGALKQQGVTGLQELGGTSPLGVGALADSTPSCRYGTSYLFRCNVDRNWSHQIHWANAGFEDPQVYFVDHTGANWPVDASTYQWNKTPNIDSIYRWNTCPSTSGVHCVQVTSANQGNSCWQGLTTLSFNSSYNITKAKVQFNDYQGGGVCSGVGVSYSKNANGYRQTACHELGHALGMGHNTATSGSCLYGTITNSSSMRLPSSQDHTLLAKPYAAAH